MKKFFLIIVTLTSFFVGTYFFNKIKSGLSIAIVYHTSINDMPIDKLKGLRYLTSLEKKELFDSLKFKEIFNIKKSYGAIQSIKQPQIILWVTNHFGQVPAAGLQWYNDNIFSKLNNIRATFWLTDLAAWRYLSLKEQVLVNNDDFVQFMRRKSLGETLTKQECPLLHDRSNLFRELIKSVESVNFLCATDFFEWLGILETKLDGNIMGLIRDDLRPGSARFSLADIGYHSPLLASIGKNSSSLLDIDNSLVFPLLQYLEGLYYALHIAERSARQGRKECNIVFLLPNKEFSYYLVPGETSPFETFRRNLYSLISKSPAINTSMNIAIYFYPFSYGNTFSDQPFEEKGNFLKSNELLNILSTIQ